MRSLGSTISRVARILLHATLCGAAAAALALFHRSLVHADLVVKRSFDLQNRKVHVIVFRSSRGWLSWEDSEQSYPSDDVFRIRQRLHPRSALFDGVWHLYTSPKPIAYPDDRLYQRLGFDYLNRIEARGTSHEHQRAVRAPLLVIAGIFIFVPAWSAIRFALRLHRNMHTRRLCRCLKCGYDLRGNHGRCSECGTPRVHTAHVLDK